MLSPSPQNWGKNEINFNTSRHDPGQKEKNVLKCMGQEELR